MYRLTLGFNSEARSDLDRIKVATEAASNAEVVRRALRLYSVITEQAALGFKRVELVDTNGNRKEVIIVP